MPQFRSYAVDRTSPPRYRRPMRWPETCRLIDRIRRERPELTVDHYGSGPDGHYQLCVYCMRRGPGEGESAASRHLVPGSLNTIYGSDGWARYKERHPEPWCRPEDSYHTDALGREIDHRGQPVLRELPAAPPVSAEQMLDRIVALGRADPDWWKKPRCSRSRGRCFDQRRSRKLAPASRCRVIHSMIAARVCSVVSVFSR